MPGHAQRVDGGRPKYVLHQGFFYVFMMQGVFSLIVNSASLFVCIWSADDKLIWLDYIRLIVWLGGFVFEFVDDAVIHL